MHRSKAMDFMAMCDERGIKYYQVGMMYFGNELTCITSDNFAEMYILTDEGACMLRLMGYELIKYEVNTTA